MCARANLPGRFSCPGRENFSHSSIVHPSSPFRSSIDSPGRACEISSHHASCETSCRLRLSELSNFKRAASRAATKRAAMRAATGRLRRLRAGPPASCELRLRASCDNFSQSTKSVKFFHNLQLQLHQRPAATINVKKICKILVILRIDFF